MSKFALGLIALIMGMAADQAAIAAQPALIVEGTEFVLYLEDGSVRRGADLAGAKISFSDTKMQLGSVALDDRATGGSVYLYRLQVLSQSGQFEDICEPDSEGHRLGFPYLNGHGAIVVTCTSGAEAKCIRWGYRPWEDGKNGIPMRNLHAACINLVRADYGGDDHPTTRNGTRIDIYDVYGVQKPAYDPSMSFEAAWGTGGALCVAHPRVKENISLDEIASRYPQLNNRLGAKACTEEGMRKNQQVLLFNRS